MKLHRTMLLSALALALAVPAASQETPKVDKRQENQEKRIEQGVESGELTKKEAGRLEAGQEKLEAKEAAAKSDGVVTKKERKQLNKSAQQQSNHVAKQKHDADKKH